MLRHGFAHQWLLKGGTEGDLMSIAGWRSAQMTRPLRAQRCGGASQGSAPAFVTGCRRMKKERILNVPLDRAWVEEDQPAPNTLRRRFFQTRDERLERARQHPAESCFDYWCQEDHNGRRCNTFLAEVYPTSEGDLWQARIEGLDEYDLAFRKMVPRGSKTNKIPRELHAHTKWLDSVDKDLVAHCPRHGRADLERIAIVDALASGKRHAQRRNGRVTFR
jgi:hypothetical protein